MERFTHTDGTSITIDGPQEKRTTALIKAAPAMLAMLEEIHQRMKTENYSKHGFRLFAEIGALIARANGATSIEGRLP